MPPCVDCGGEWGMYESELKFYESLKEKDSEFKMTGRCKPCRDKKKAAFNNHNKVNLNKIIQTLNGMAEKSVTQCYYTYRDEELANELTDISEKLRLYVNQYHGGKNGNRENS
jgi:predicted adenine nucleotide alpha hydrolase (AANH) superfamily ATPase